MERKKIAFVSVFYPFRGGIALFSDKVLLALQKKYEAKGYNFKRQYPNFLFPGKTQFVQENDRVTRSENLRILDSINPFSYFKTAKAINEQEVNVLITRYWMSFFAPALGTIAKCVSKKTVKIALLDNVIPHEKRFFDDVFNRYYLNAHDGFIVMSEQVGSDLKAYLPNAKVLLLDHPKYNQFGAKVMQQDAQMRLEIRTTKKTLLFFGLIRDYKGLDQLIEAFNQLDETYQLVIAGECYGSFEKYQEQINRNVNKERIVVFNQFIPDDKIADFFSTADLCVMPYKTATQSGIHAISDHFEIPTLVTNVGGLPEYITDGETGVLVNDVSPNGIKNGIERFFTLKATTDFAANLRAKKKSITWDEFAEKIIEFADQLKK